MATHDYIISNASGAAVRADLNNALAAIVSNNSNATSPATTYAFQFWADTTTGQLKIRNAANSAWITLMELDGTMLMEDGTVSSPGLAFASDLNTGFFRSAADKINFATGGAERLEIGSSEVVFNDPSNDVDFRVESNGNTHMLFVDAGNDRVGMGTSSPANTLHISKEANHGITLSRPSGGVNPGDFQVQVSSNGAGSLIADNNLTLQTGGSQQLIVKRGATESIRIDTSGRLLVGTTSDTAPGAFNAKIQTASTSFDGSISLRRDSDSAGSQSLVFGKSRSSSLNGNTIVQSGDALGTITFFGADGTDLNTPAAQILAAVDGTPGSNDMPGRLVFSTTADGASSATERLRIDRAGSVGIDFTPKRMHANVTSSLNVGSSSLFQRTNDSFITSNFYYNTSDVGKSIASGYGVMYSQNTANGRHNFNVSAASAGSADATHSLQTKASIDNDGLKFNGDTAAANALDDYEEGEWIPTVIGSTGGTATLNTGVKTLLYNKIGRQVTISGRINITSVSGLTGALQITNFPFANINTTAEADFGHLHITAHGFDFPSDAQGSVLFVELSPGASGGSIFYLRDDLSWTTPPISAFDGSNTGLYIHVNGTYMT